MADIGSIVVNVVARTSKFAQGMRGARRDLTRFEKASKTATATFGRLNSALGLLGATIGAGAFIASLRNTAQELDKLAKTSEKLGIASDELAALRFAGEQTGVAVNTLDMALQRMVRRVNEAAAGTGEAKDAIKQLGLDAGTLASMSPDKQFRAIAEAMQGVKREGEQVRLAFKLFDSEGVALVNTLRLGERGLDDMERKARDLGIAISGEELDKVEEFNDAMNELSKLVGGIKSEIVIKMAPGLTKFVRDLQDTIKGLEMTGNAVSRFIDEQFPVTKALLQKLDTADATEKKIREDLRRGIATSAPGATFKKGSVQDLMRTPEGARQLLEREGGRAVARREAEIAHRQRVAKAEKEREEALRGAAGFFKRKMKRDFSAATERARMFGEKVQDAAKTVNRLNEAGKKEAIKALPGRVFEALFPKRDLDLGKGDAKGASVLNRNNDVLLANTVEGFKALRANLAPDINRAQLNELKRQTQTLEDILRGLGDGVKLEAVGI